MWIKFDCGCELLDDAVQQKVDKLRSLAFQQRHQDLDYLWGDLGYTLVLVERTQITARQLQEVDIVFDLVRRHLLA